MRCHWLSATLTVPNRTSRSNKYMARSVFNPSQRMQKIFGVNRAAILAAAAGGRTPDAFRLGV